MNIFVSRLNLPDVIKTLNEKPILVWDCETTGLKAYHDSEVFSVAISDGADNWYFNFQSYPDLEEIYLLKPSDLKPIMEIEDRVWIAHNAKFDLHFTDRAGIKPHGIIVDTEVLARLYNNNHNFSGGYSLDACCKRWLGVAKDDRVKQWMDENNGFVMRHTAGNKPEKHYLFYLVPFEIISKYAMQDAEITFKLYEFLDKNMYETKARGIETNLTPVLFEMEKRGVLVDHKYCFDAHAYELSRLSEFEKRLSQICGGEFVDSAKFLAPKLEQRGFQLPTTEAGTPQITDEVLSSREDELAKTVLDYREASKRAQTYWLNYLTLIDEDDVIHPNFKQAGTVTGRMSCNQPNLQNIPAEDGGPFPIRRAFIARPGMKLVSIDYKAMEFRLLLDYAGDKDLIEKIKAGYDPHQATADLTSLQRKAAKILNFGIAYRMGVAKIAKAIGVSEAEAKAFRYRYFGVLPGVRKFIYDAPDRQKARGFCFSWTGRRFYLEVGKDGRDFSYKAANSIIQGGCAEIVKLAMCRLHEFLKPYQTKMVLQVHDEIVFEAPESEFHLIPEITRIMREAYTPTNGMDMDCSVSIGENLYDLEDYAG